ncbi:MAG: hypothetical protein WA160_13175 [Pseudobdellovibrio sp.]
MKNLVVLSCLTILALTSAKAFAQVSSIAEIRETGGLINEAKICVDPKLRDAGYTVNFSADLQTATLSEMTIIGSSVLAELVCVDTLASFGPGIPKAKNVVLFCKTDELLDGGYSITIKRSTRSKQEKAIIKAITFAGEETLATIPCN